MHRFADTSAVEGFLRELASRPAGTLAVELPRPPGARETRWSHLLAGAARRQAPRTRSVSATTGKPVPDSELDALRTEMAQLKADVAELRQAIASLRSQGDTSEP